MGCLAGQKEGSNATYKPQNGSEGELTSGDECVEEEAN